MSGDIRESVSKLSGTQYAVHGPQYTAHSTQYTVHCAQYTVHSTQHTVHSTQYTVHITHYTVHSEQCQQWSNITFTTDIPVGVSDHKYISLIFIDCQSHTTTLHFMSHATTFSSNLSHRQSLWNNSDKQTNKTLKLQLQYNSTNPD